MKRFLAVFGLNMLFMAILAVILLAVILLAGDNDSAILIAILVIFVVGIGAFIPYFDWAVKRVFHFPGEGTPVPVAELRAQTTQRSRSLRQVRSCGKIRLRRVGSWPEMHDRA